jgi:hypothetical protein
VGPGDEEQAFRLLGCKRPPPLERGHEVGLDLSAQASRLAGDGELGGRARPRAGTTVAFQGARWQLGADGTVEDRRQRRDHRRRVLVGEDRHAADERAIPGDRVERLGESPGSIRVVG